jgi:hypothetical protein
MQVTKFASATSATSWVNQVNILADDGNLATYTIATKNTTGSHLVLSGYGFDSVIPAGALITSVNIRAQYHVSTTSGVAHVELAPELSGVSGTFFTDSTEPIVPRTLELVSVARPGGGSWTRADF